MAKRDEKVDFRDTVSAMRFESPVGHDQASLDMLAERINAMDDGEFARFHDAYTKLI